MDEEQQQKYRERLEQLAEALQASLASADASKESIAPDNAIGRLTRMEAIQAQSMNAETRRRQKKRLEQVRRALDSIEEGTYGLCVRCGEEIPRGRLDIVPETRLCVTCAARHR